MRFYNINNTKEVVGLREAVLKSISVENGLYMPEYIPQLPSGFMEHLPGMGLREIALVVSSLMLGNDIGEHELKRIIERSLNFPIPVKGIHNNMGVLELFHGPTLAFKDVGARFMAGLFESLLKDENKEITILVATSGDTGGAVADAFYGKQGVKVVILYPSGKVSELQERQLTTLGGNITALEIEGNFDDCQRMVKQAFSDQELNRKIELTSANSINFARLLPQSFYYFFACSQVMDQGKKLVFSVPSGNFGNLTAGMIARKMGLPVEHFIAATNANNAVPVYLNTGIYELKSTIHTYSNAMDVGNPSNFPRMKELEGEYLNKMVSGEWFSDQETEAAMRKLDAAYNYIADPHGAVAYLGLEKRGLRSDEYGIFLETAHPSKFSDIVEHVTGKVIEFPDRLNVLREKEMRKIKMKNTYSDLRSFLLT